MYRSPQRNSVTSAIVALQRVRQFIAPSTLQIMKKYLIQPYVDYYGVVLEAPGAEVSLTLQILPNRSAGMVTFPSCDFSSGPLLQELIKVRRQTFHTPN